jgi:undecaprenyl-diphosphatase
MPPPERALPLRHALALGALHGPAELLPVSSSGHVALVPWLLGWPYVDLDDELRKGFEVALHAGTAAALLAGGGTGAWERSRAPLVLGALLPPALAGLVLERPVERRLGTPATIAVGLALGGVALAAADRWGGVRRTRADATLADALALGVAQALALAPGTSRSGMALSAARARGFARRDAQALAFEAALPVIAGASALKLARLARRGLPRGLRRAFAAGAGAAFASTLAARGPIQRGQAERPLAPFAAYRVGLAALVLARGAARRRWQNGPR